MFIDKDSIIVNDISLGQYIVEAKYQYNKLWANDSGRNLAGEMSGTFLGHYPKIIVHFRKLTKTELELLVPILDGPTQTLTYYDPNKKQSITIDTYTGDYEIDNTTIVNGNRKNEGFEISFIAIRRR